MMLAALPTATSERLSTDRPISQPRGGPARSGAALPSHTNPKTTRNLTKTTLDKENIQCYENAFPLAGGCVSNPWKPDSASRSLPVGGSTTMPDAATQAQLSAAYGQLPLSFQINKGQTDPRVNFLTQGVGYTAFLTPNSAVLAQFEVALF